MKYKLPFNLLMPLASSKLEGKTCRNLLALVVMVFVINGVMGQASITSSSAVTDALTGYLGTTATVPPNWTLSTTGTAAGNGINQTTGTAGGWYGNGNISFLGSGSASNGNATWLLQNNTGSTISGFTLAFTARLWKSGSNSPSVTVSYSNSGTITNPAAGALTNALSSLTFNDGTINVSTGASMSQTVSGLTIPNGQYIFVRFIHAGGSSSDNLGWDDLSFTPTLVLAPEINIKQSTTSYASGSTYAFGNQIASTSSSATTFTIENTGNASLNLSGSPLVAVTGNTSEFTVDQTSTAATVAALGTTSFTVTFNPTSTGAKSAAISIANNDATGSENPYVINLTGTGTVNSSSASDIITQSGYTYTSNIDYASKQTASSLTIANSVGVNGFTLRDGGATIDADALGTTLTDISFSTGGSTAIRTAALFDGTNNIAEVAVSGATSIVFTGLSLSATDGGTKDFELRVTYQSSVTDNQQITYTVSSATASSLTSNFATVNAGAAASSATGDNNRLEVTASALAFVAQPTNTLVSASMTNVTVSANDALANRDLDFTSSVRITSTGTLTGTPVDVNASSGLATFNSLTHTALGSSLTLNAERTSGLDWDVASSTFDITVQAPGLLLLEDNFTHSAILTSNGYTEISGTGTNNLIAGATGLTYTNYGSSNIGNALAIRNTGQDVYRTFTQQNSPTTVYASFLVNVSAAQSGDYFFAFAPSAGSTTYRARTFVKASVNSGFINFGISNSGTVNYNSTPTDYPINTTHLVVVKYTFTSATSATAQIFINPNTTSEPSLSEVSFTDNTVANAPADINSFSIRQGTLSNAPTLVMDGIRIATNWGALMGNPQYTDNTIITAGNYNSITTYAGSTPSVTGNVNVYNQLSILGGTLTTNNTLTLKSNANGTAQVAAIGSGGSITGNVTVERYIPQGKRAFRLLSPAVTTTTFISGNWQQQTHITGGASGGFDVTETNNPSMFTYNNNAPSGSGWTAIANTNATNLTAGVGYRVLVRGDKTPANITSASADEMNVAITLSATGTLKTGTVTLNSSSTPSINNTANTTTADYSLVGNPYQSAVDWNAVTKSGIEATYWAWDPNMGTSTQRGRYVAFNGTTNDNVDSEVEQFIQPGQAFFVKNTTSGAAGTLTFEEAHKATTSANVFRNANIPTLAVALYDPNELAIGAYPIDATKAVFSADYTNELGLGDAAKLEAAGENIAWFRNNTKLAIDAAAPVTTSDELAMKTLRLGANKNYTFKIQTTNFDTDLTPYLVDNFLNTQTAISTSEVYLANFSTTSNVASYGEDRFKIVFQTSALSTDDFVKNIKLYPNPAKAGGSFYIDGITEATVLVYNVVGQNIPVTVMSQGNAVQVTPTTALSQGVYLVTVTTAGKTTQVKWIVE